MKFLALSLSDVVFIMLINVKMPTIFCILTFMSRMNFVLSWVEYEKSFITSDPGLYVYRLNQATLANPVLQNAIKYDKCSKTFCSPLKFESLIHTKCFSQQPVKGKKKTFYKISFLHFLPNFSHQFQTLKTNVLKYQRLFFHYLNYKVPYNITSFIHKMLIRIAYSEDWSDCSFRSSLIWDCTV